MSYPVVVTPLPRPSGVKLLADHVAGFLAEVYCELLEDETVTEDIIVEEIVRWAAQVLAIQLPTSVEQLRASGVAT